MLLRMKLLLLVFLCAGLTYSLDEDDGFQSVEDTHLVPRQKRNSETEQLLQEVTENLTKLHKINNNSTISAAEKEKEREPIQQKLDELKKRGKDNFGMSIIYGEGENFSIVM